MKQQSKVSFRHNISTSKITSLTGRDETLDKKFNSPIKTFHIVKAAANQIQMSHSVMLHFPVCFNGIRKYNLVKLLCSISH